MDHLSIWNILEAIIIRQKLQHIGDVHSCILPLKLLLDIDDVHCLQEDDEDFNNDCHVVEEIENFVIDTKKKRYITRFCPIINAL